MQQILVYADSLTWGIIPDTRKRLPFHQRWPQIMEATLVAAGHAVRVIEDALNGRRTVWDDPYKPGRNGLEGLEQRMEVNSPLALVVLMLGTNDFQSVHANNVQHSALGVAALVRAIRRAPIEPGMPVPEILVIAPPLVGAPKSTSFVKFCGAEVKMAGLPEAFEQITKELGCHFYDAGKVISCSAIDGVHLDADQHAVLGRAMAEFVGMLLPRNPTE
jgi:lysophospholipase L1-like esterase